MMSSPLLQGTLHASLLWARSQCEFGARVWRVVYKLTGHDEVPPMECRIPEGRIYARPKNGDRVWLQFSGAQVMRVERAS